MIIPRRIRKFLRDHTDFNIEEIAAALRDHRIRYFSADSGAWERPQETTLVYEDDEVLLDHTKVEPRPKVKGAFLLFKPKGVITTTKDPRGKRDLSAWLSRLPKGYFPVGRLDRETTGALLIVNDGDLATAILRPEHHLKKTYWLWLNEELAPEDPRLAAWLDGIALPAGRARAHSVQVVHSDLGMTELHVTLQEGKNRQIRRMCRISDFRLMHLHRKTIGPLDLAGMAPGNLRALAPQELDVLWERVGGRERVLSAQCRALLRRAESARASGAPDERLESWLATTGRPWSTALGAPREPSASSGAP